MGGWNELSQNQRSAKIAAYPPFDFAEQCAVSRWSICQDPVRGYVYWGAGPNQTKDTEWWIDTRVEATLNARARNFSIGITVKPQLKNFVSNNTVPKMKVEWWLFSNGAATYPDEAIEPQTIFFGSSTNEKRIEADVSTPFSALNDETWGVKVKITAVGSPSIGPVAEYSSPKDKTQLRCDNGSQIFPTAMIEGCVNIAWTPSVVFDSSAMPDVAANMQAGQAAHGNVGVYPNEALVRNTQAERAANYSATCANYSYTFPRIGDRPQPNEDWQCDEYPFASTTKGGVGNTIAWVPASQNSSQGGTLGAMYTKNRVMPGDWFYVDIQ